MGRLTLNILLSLAQFEREVTGERIRDKIAASKRRGMWMGGNLPLGYDLRDRKLVINLAEAETVRYIRSLMHLALLTPQVVVAIVQGRQPADLTTMALVTSIDLPLSWQEQAQALGIQ